MEKIRNFFKDETGATAVEYGLLVTLIALAIIGGATFLGSHISDLYSSAGGKLTVAS